MGKIESGVRVVEIRDDGVRFLRKEGLEARKGSDYGFYFSGSI